MKIALFGCGTIAKRIAKSLKLVEGLDFVGFASKDIEKAKQYANDYNCKEYGDYQYFLNSDVDAIYIATYNLSHYDLIKQCLLANKNVICEKPMLANRQQYEELYKLANQHHVLLMEALKSVFLPSIIKIKQLIDDGTIGQIKYASANFTRKENFPENHYIFDLACGGALKDLGTYCVGTLNYLLGCKPTLVSYKWDRTNKKAESDCQLQLNYQNIKADVDVSSSRSKPCFLIIETTKATIKAENFWKNNQFTLITNDKETTYQLEMISDFYYEIKHFKELVESKQTESNIMSKQFCLDMIDITNINK